MSKAIKLEGITKRLGNRNVLKDVSFTVEEGDIFGYLGPNGAGKTTTIRVLLGLFKPETGYLKGVGELDETGHVITKDTMETSVPGIFAAGDIRHNAGRQSALPVTGQRQRFMLKNT